MKRLIFALALSSLSLGAAARWTPLIVDSMVITYVDPSLQRGKGGMFKMWWLVDYQLVQVTDEKGYFSRLQRSEFDCRGGRVRVLSVALLTQPMGQGEPVFEDRQPRQWERLQGQPYLQALADIACKND